MKRLFIALHICDECRNLIYKEICRSSAFSGIRISSPENLHLTLSFLGDTDERSIPGIRNMLQSLDLEKPVRALKFTEVGCFPAPDRPRVIWLGIAPNRDLDRLQKMVRSGLDSLGMNYDRKPFRAHLTLGRVPESANGILERSVQAMKETAAAVRIPDSPLRYVILYESILKSGGPLYKALATKDLNNE